MNTASEAPLLSHRGELSLASGLGPQVVDTVGVEVGEPARPRGPRRHKIITAIAVFRTSYDRAVVEGLKGFENPH